MLLPAGPEAAPRNRGDLWAFFFGLKKKCTFRKEVCNASSCWPRGRLEKSRRPLFFFLDSKKITGSANICKMLLPAGPEAASRNRGDLWAFFFGPKKKVQAPQKLAKCFFLLEQGRLREIGVASGQLSASPRGAQCLCLLARGWAQI